MVKRTQEVFQNPDIRQWSRKAHGFADLTDSGSGIAAGSLVNLASNAISTGTEQSGTIIGVVPTAVTASAKSDVDWGSVNVKLGSTVAVGDKISARENGRAGKTMTAQATIVNANAGGNFANQPAGDGVEIVSDSASDTQTCTIYGTITGATDTVTSETVTLTGTDAVSTTITTWQNILGVKLGSAAVGTITIREASGDLAITTISAAATSAGVATLATTDGYGLVLRHDASGASTAPVGVIGTATDGTATSAVDALNGTTEEDHLTVAFATVTDVLIGAVASGVNVTILSNEVVDSVSCGIATQAGNAGDLVEAYVVPYFFADA